MVHDKIDAQRIKDEQNRINANDWQMKSFSQSLQQHYNAQAHIADEIERLKYVPEKIIVLFFATNPCDTDRLRLDEEVRSIQEMIRKSEHRNSIFYSSLGFGFPVQKAFEQAKGALMLESPDEQDTPALYLKVGIDANSLYIVRPKLSEKSGGNHAENSE